MKTTSNQGHLIHPLPEPEPLQNGPLTVVCVAFLLRSGVVLSAPRPARHHHLIYHTAVISRWVWRLCQRGHVQGFLLSDGSFADRDRAGVVAFEAGQITEHRLGSPHLFSEDVW